MQKLIFCKGIAMPKQSALRSGCVTVTIVCLWANDDKIYTATPSLVSLLYAYSVRNYLYFDLPKYTIYYTIINSEHDIVIKCRNGRKHYPTYSTTAQPSAHFYKFIKPVIHNMAHEHPTRMRIKRL